MLRHLVLVWVGFILFCELHKVSCQRSNVRNNKRKPTPTKKPVGGRWIPLHQRLAAEKRRQNAAKENKNNNAKPNPSRGNIQFDDLIQPPLQRLPNEVELQEPSWTHCLHNVQIDESWSVISSPNYPKPIPGQLQCTWMFEGARGSRVQISFNVLDLFAGNSGGCGNQFIDIIDMELRKSQGRFCGDRVPGDYISVGRKLRLDIHGDTTVTPHKGFRAAIRVVSRAMQAGLRQRSTMFHGEDVVATTTSPARRPITRSPSSPNRRPIVTSETSTATTTTAYFVHGQIIYGPKNQPLPIVHLNTYEASDINTTLILYIFIGLFCLLVVLSGMTFIFRKQLYSKYKQRKQKKKGKKGRNNESEEETKEENKPESDDEKEENTEAHENPAFSNGRFELPESRPTTPSLDGRRRRSVIFEDEVLAGVVREQPRREENAAEVKKDDAANVFKTQQSGTNYPEKNNPHFQGWNYPNGEPIYEDDALSVSSYSSARSINRHPDRPSMQQTKMTERNGSAARNEGIYAPLSEPMYHMGPPGPHPGPPNMAPQFNPAFMPPYYDPRNYYPMHPHMMTRHESFTRGRPMMPPNYNESHRDVRLEVPPPIYDDYHQGRLLQPSKEIQKSQDDINLHKQQPENAGSTSRLRPARSVGDLSIAGNDNAFGSTTLFPAQSMAALPQSSNNFPESGMRQRSVSFTI